MATTEIKVVGSIDPTELERLYFLAGRDRDGFTVECDARFDIHGTDAMRTGYAIHAHGITAYPAAGPTLQVLRSDLYPQAVIASVTSRQP